MNQSINRSIEPQALKLYLTCIDLLCLALTNKCSHQQYYNLYIQCFIWKNIPTNSLTLSNIRFFEITSLNVAMLSNLPFKLEHLSITLDYVDSVSSNMLLPQTLKSLKLQGGSKDLQIPPNVSALTVCCKHENLQYPFFLKQLIIEWPTSTTFQTCGLQVENLQVLLLQCDILCYNFLNFQMFVNLQELQCTLSELQDFKGFPASLTSLNLTIESALSTDSNQLFLQKLTNLKKLFLWCYQGVIGGALNVIFPPSLHELLLISENCFELGVYDLIPKSLQTLTLKHSDVFKYNYTLLPLNITKLSMFETMNGNFTIFNHLSNLTCEINTTLICPPNLQILHMTTKSGNIINYCTFPSSLVVLRVSISDTLQKNEEKINDNILPSSLKKFRLDGDLKWLPFRFPYGVKMLTLNAIHSLVSDITPLPQCLGLKRLKIKSKDFNVALPYNFFHECPQLENIKIGAVWVIKRFMQFVELPHSLKILHVLVFSKITLYLTMLPKNLYELNIPNTLPIRKQIKDWPFQHCVNKNRSITLYFF